VLKSLIAEWALKIFFIFDLMTMWSLDPHKWGKMFRNRLRSSEENTATGQTLRVNSLWQD